MTVMNFWLNGEFQDNSKAIDIADRGFLLGDGVFETILMVDGQPAFLQAHLERLRSGVTALGIGADIIDTDVGHIVRELAQRNGTARGMGSARITLTRGPGARGLAYAMGENDSTMLITASAYAPSAYAAPASLILSQHRRNEYSLTARLKTTNYLDNILARQEAVSAGADEAIMMNLSGRVACASAANIVMVQQQTIKTPPVEEGALPGIVRGVLLTHAETIGLEIAEEAINLEELSTSALMLTNSLIGVRSARLLEGRGGNAVEQDIIALLKSCYERALKNDLADQKAAR